MRSLKFEHVKMSQVVGRYCKSARPDCQRIMPEIGWPLKAPVCRVFLILRRLLLSGGGDAVFLKSFPINLAG
jgi:hypothetical protein